MTTLPRGVREAGNAFSAAIGFIASKGPMDADELWRLACVLAFGYELSEVERAVGEAHGRLFDGVGDFGVGVKFAHTTNYCDLDITTGDEITQKILAEDNEIAHEAAALYFRFNELVEKIISRRLDRISDSTEDGLHTREQISESPNFMLSLKARYHGGSLQELGDRWGKAFSVGLPLLPHECETDADRARKSAAIQLRLQRFAEGQD